MEFAGKSDSEIISAHLRKLPNIEHLVFDKVRFDGFVLIGGTRFKTPKLVTLDLTTSENETFFQWLSIIIGGDGFSSVRKLGVPNSDFLCLEHEYWLQIYWNLTHLRLGCGLRDREVYWQVFEDLEYVDVEAGVVDAKVDAIVSATKDHLKAIRRHDRLPGEIVWETKSETKKETQKEKNSLSS